LKTSDPSNQIIVSSTAEINTLKINFDYLDSNEGLILKILHGKDFHLKLSGKIKGNGKIKQERTIHGIKEIKLKKIVFFSLVLLEPIIILGIIYSKNDRGFMFLIALFVGISFLKVGAKLPEKLSSSFNNE
jgi:hypothetical protein